MVRRTAAISALVLAALLALPAASAAFSSEQRQRMQELAEAEMKQSSYPGMIVGVWQRRHGSFRTAMGVSDTGTNEPLRFDQQMRVGSMTKTFTATVVLRLAEQGRLRLGDRVSDWVGFVPQGNRMTIRNLLAHTGGLPTLDASVAEQTVEHPHRTWRPRVVARRAARYMPACLPRQCWSYSNAGYILLGIIVREASGKSLSELYEQEAFEPAGLKDTAYAPNGHPPAGIAHGYYEIQPGTFVDSTDFNFSWATSAGAMVSTAPDMKRWAEAIATGRGLLSPSMQRRRLTYSAKFTGYHPFAYGLGIARFGTYLGHNGIVFGYEAMVQHSPRAHATIVIMGNTSSGLDDPPGPDPDLFDLAQALRRTVADGA